MVRSNTHKVVLKFLTLFALNSANSPNPVRHPKKLVLWLCGKPDQTCADEGAATPDRRQRKTNSDD